MRELTDNIADALPKAAAVFAERGLDGTRMDDIVEATGVPRPTLYYHFSSKEEILAWLLQRLLRDLSIEIGGIVDRDEPARDRLRSIIAAYLQLFADHTQLCTVLLTELGRITRIPALADAIWAAFHEPLGKVLDAGERDGSMRARRRHSFPTRRSSDLAAWQGSRRRRTRRFHASQRSRDDGLSDFRCRHDGRPPPRRRRPARRPPRPGFPT